MAEEVIQPLPQTAPVSATRRQEMRSVQPQEVELVRWLAAARFGLTPGDPRYMALVNYYVALKAKPVVVLVGPAGGGKEALACRVAEAIVGRCAEKHQVLPGHPWWATGTIGPTAHARWNELKLDALAEEAAQPENRHRAFFACLQHVSPAELDDLSVSAERPYPLFPPNLFIAATLDMDTPVDVDDGLLAVATMVWWPDPWPPAEGSRKPQPLTEKAERIFVKSAVRRMPTARRRLRRLFSGTTQPTRALVEITGMLAESGVKLGPAVMDDAMRYLANSWSTEGVGLFHWQPAHNLAISLDYVVAQTILTRAICPIADRPALRDSLRACLRDRFPYSATWLAAI